MAEVTTDLDRIIELLKQEETLVAFVPDNGWISKPKRLSTPLVVAQFREPKYKGLEYIKAFDGKQKYSFIAKDSVPENLVEALKNVSDRAIITLCRNSHADVKLNEVILAMRSEHTAIVHVNKNAWTPDMFSDSFLKRYDTQVVFRWEYAHFEDFRFLFAIEKHSDRPYITILREELLTTTSLEIALHNVKDRTFYWDYNTNQLEKWRG